MSAFIITKKGLTKNGRELMLDFYETIHDEDFLKFDEFQKQRKYYDENVVEEYGRILSKESKQKLFKNTKTGAVIKVYNFDDKSRPIPLPIDESYIEMTKDEIKNNIKDEIINKKIDIEFVFDFLKEMDEKLNLDTSLEFEGDEDLFCLKKAFLKAYDLFYLSGSNLKD